MEEEVKEKKQLSPKAKKIINIVIDVAVALVLAFALLLAVCSISSKVKGYSKYTEFFGTAYLGVESDSMNPEFKKGDLIKIKTISTADARKLKVGDIITFTVADIDGDGKLDLNTHRIVEIFNGTEGNANSYRTQGDNREISKTPETVLVGDIVGVYQGKASGIGNLFLFMGSSTGFFVCVVLPTLLVVVYCAVNLILVIRKEKIKQAAVTEQAQQIAQLEERERIRQELLAEMQANSAAEAQPAADVTEREPQPAATETEQETEPQSEEVVEEKEVSSEDNKAEEDNKSEKD